MGRYASWIPSLTKLKHWQESNRPPHQHATHAYAYTFVETLAKLCLCYLLKLAAFWDLVHSM